MAARLPSCDKARVLLCNDDGIHAPGIKALLRCIAPLCAEVWVVAPEHECSGAAHSLTLHRPLRLRQMDSHTYAVDGTPTDCVLLAVKRILKDNPPDLLLSGFNAGGNLGEDITYSGTVAAAMEATVLGIPAIALSQLRAYDQQEDDWQVAHTWTPQIIDALIKHDWHEGVFFNVNFPCCTVGEVQGIETTFQGRHCGGGLLEEKIDPRGRPYFWVGNVGTHIKPEKGSDLDAIARNKITITPLHLDLTHRPSMDTLSL